MFPLYLLLLNASLTNSFRGLWSLEVPICHFLQPYPDLSSSQWLNFLSRVKCSLLETISYFPKCYNKPSVSLPEIFQGKKKRSSTQFQSIMINWGPWTSSGTPPTVIFAVALQYQYPLLTQSLSTQVAWIQLLAIRVILNKLFNLSKPRFQDT